jgi:succinate dehydrogenase/fumarate reductase flavoprotein subunit
MESSVERVQVDAAGAYAVMLRQGNERRTIRARGGIILASGGFNRHARLRSQLLPGIERSWCPGAPGHTGETHDLALSVGARYGTGGMSNAFWAPVSVRKRPDGSTAVFPHFLMDRAKPGMITVDSSGKRFVNESTSYHLFALRMQATQAVPAFLIADAVAVRKYGIGMARPGGRRVDHFLADGYLTKADSLSELAARLGIDADTLVRTVERFNAIAAAGVDNEFRRGTTAYQLNLGDPDWDGPNPCLGPLAEAPFYAVRLYPGDIGAATGFVTDEKARVLDKTNRPIRGLYAVGNDMHSIMGGVYPGPGITLGPALVFGYLAGRHAARRARVVRATALSDTPAILRQRSA